MTPEQRRILGSSLTGSLDENLRIIRETFHYPRNSDLTVRVLRIERRAGFVRAAVVYMVGLADEETIRDNVIAPMLRLSQTEKPERISARSVMENTISSPRVRTATTFSQIVDSLVEGGSVVLIDGDDVALLLGTESAEHRAVSESPTEAVVRGPHTGFIENVSANVALVRGMLASPDLVAERIFVGARSHSPYVIMYMEGVANPKIVDEVRRRITSLSVDAIGVAGYLSNQIQDTPLDPLPTYIATERPDTCAFMISEGHVCIMDSSPSAILVPATIWSLLHSPEDYYIHFLPASLIRLLRWLALFSTLYASAIYVAVVTFHPSMLPTELLFAVAATREAVPFPAAFEVMFMEAAFELIREAGLRIPTIVGPTIGIVGAVILGQAAVQAGIISPILVVIVAIAGLGSFAIPNYNLSLYVRIVRYLLIGAAAVLGIPGLSLATLLLMTHIAGKKSFGVPVTAPLVPSFPHSPDLMVVGPPASMVRRPGHLHPLDAVRRKPVKGIENPGPPRPRNESGEARS
ncbi:MAG: spore germination protein [Bacillota bacterium]